MKMQMNLQVLTRVTWLLVAFVTAGIGIGGVWWPASQELSSRHAHALELYNEANAVDAALRRAAELRAAQSRISSDLAALSGARSPGAVTAALLRLLHEESKTQRVDIREVSPDSNAHMSSGTAHSTAPSPQALIPSDLSISVRGPFRSVVALITDLPRHDVLIDVHDVQLSTTQTGRVPPLLDVTLHSTVYRLSAPLPLETSRVRSVR
jgi:hypothetical protein